MAGRRQQDYDYLVKLLLIGDSGAYDTLKHRWLSSCLLQLYPTCFSVWYQSLHLIEYWYPKR